MRMLGSIDSTGQPEMKSETLNSSKLESVVKTDMVDNIVIVSK